MADNTETFFEASQGKPVTPDTPPVAIRPVETPPPAPPRATPGIESLGYLRPFGNDRLNSRLGGRLPEAGAWKIRRQTDLPQGSSPLWVLQGGDRILVQEPIQWHLFDADGQLIHKGPLGASNVFLDPANSSFYAADVYGYVRARRLDDGADWFRIEVYFGRDCKRTLIARRDRRLVIAGTDILVNPHGGERPNIAVVETQELGDPIQPESNGFLITKRVGELIRKSSLMLVALDNDTIIISTPGRIHLANLNMRISAEFDGQFEPVSMSLDETGRIYLVVKTGGRTALWLLSPRGERLLSFVFPPDMEVSAVPPIVGYDHRAFIIGSDRLLVVNTDGKLAWVRGGRVAGAAVTADDQLLVSDGSELAAYDAQGKRRVLYDFKGEVLSTPPVLTAGGDLLVASPRHLFVLSPQAAAQKP